MPNAEGRNLLKELREFFAMSAGDFAREYKKLGDQDKKDLKKGIEDGTLTY
jgi:hypothetical protein